MKNEIKIISLVDGKILIGKTEEINNGSSDIINFYKITMPLLINITGRAEIIYMAEYVPFTDTKEVFISVDKIVYFPVEPSEKVIQLYNLYVEYIKQGPSPFEEVLDYSLKYISDKKKQEKQQDTSSEEKELLNMINSFSENKEYEKSNDKVIDIREAIEKALEKKSKLDS